MIYTPPQVGPQWISDLFYFLLSTVVRAAEGFYMAVDAVAYWLGLVPDADDSEFGGTIE